MWKYLCEQEVASGSYTATSRRVWIVIIWLLFLKLPREVPRRTLDCYLLVRKGTLSRSCASLLDSGRLRANRETFLSRRQ